MDYGSFELVQTCHSLTRVTEDLERFLLAEARLQTLVHKVHHLTTCTHTNIEMQNTTILQKALRLRGFSQRFLRRIKAETLCEIRTVNPRFKSKQLIKSVSLDIIYLNTRTHMSALKSICKHFRSQLASKMSICLHLTP